MDRVDHNELPDDVVTQALGEELRILRERAGWTRSELVERMSSEVSITTVGTYERGVRHCTVVRLVEISRVLGAAPEDVLSIALRRAAITFRGGLRQVNLQLLVNDGHREYEAIRRWATHRLRSAPGSTLVDIEQAALSDMAALAGCTSAQLVAYLARFAK